MDKLSDLRQRLSSGDTALAPKATRARALAMMAGDEKADVKVEIGPEYYKAKHRDRKAAL